MLSLMPVEYAITTVLNKLEGRLSLKEEKTTGFRGFVDKKDAFAVLPKGFIPSTSHVFLL